MMNRTKNKIRAKTMNKINRKHIKIKNLLGIIDNPTYEDLLFEIASFLEDENRDEFKKWDVSMKTRSRINSTIEEDLNVLVERGYLEHQGWTKFKLVNHPWT